MKTCGKFFIFFLGSILTAQNPVCRYTDFTPTIKGISFGPASSGSERCFFWLNSPSAQQVQIACYAPNDPIPIHNEINRISPNGVEGTWVFPDGAVSWLIKPNEFHFVGAGSDHIEILKDGTF
jgi:hypothetical protein